MCEYRVYLENELVFEDVVYARDLGGRVILKNVTGLTKIVENCKILEVNVDETKILLAKL